MPFDLIYKIAHLFVMFLEYLEQKEPEVKNERDY